MGQIKNIKLHIVTDIKVQEYNGTIEKVNCLFQLWLLASFHGHHA